MSDDEYYKSELRDAQNQISSLQEQIQKTIEFGFNYGGFDGAHHKMWCIDQMIRLLTGSQTRYEELVKESCDGEDGPETYEWDEGIPP